VLSDRVFARGILQPDTVRTMVRSHLAGENHSERLWALLTFELWQRIFMDGEDPAAINMRPATGRAVAARAAAA
jgi:hypothetical protein